MQEVCASTFPLELMRNSRLIIRFCFTALCVVNSTELFTGRGLTQFHGEKQTPSIDAIRPRSAVCP